MIFIGSVKIASHCT